MDDTTDPADFELNEAGLNENAADGAAEGEEPQRDVVDRRAADRRQSTAPFAGPDRRLGDRRTGLERRRGAGIRREEDRRSAEEGEMTVEQFEFVQAIEAFKKSNAVQFPTWLHVIEVVHALGYQLVDEPTLDVGDAKIMNPDFAHLTGEPAQFVKAIEAYKTVNKKRFPTWTEVLEVVEQLGYRKVATRTIALENVPEAPIRAVA